MLTLEWDKEKKETAVSRIFCHSANLTAIKDLQIHPQNRSSGSTVPQDLVETEHLGRM